MRKNKTFWWSLWFWMFKKNIFEFGIVLVSKFKKKCSEFLTNPSCVFFVRFNFKQSIKFNVFWIYFYYFNFKLKKCHVEISGSRNGFRFVKNVFGGQVWMFKNICEIWKVFFVRQIVWRMMVYNFLKRNQKASAAQPLFK